MNIASKRRSRTGFTLIEALAAIAVVGIGLTSVLGALGAIANGESRAKETEAMYRLAADKFEEMAATREYLTAATNGDFKDIGEDRYIWTAEVQPTGIENLDALVVTVERESRNSPMHADVSGLIYNAPVATGATGAAGPGGGGTP